MRVAAAWAAAVVGGLLLQGCGAGAEARRARLEVQREHLEASLDRLEARLLDGRSRVRLWEELRARHGQVAAVTCEVNGRHAADMARLAEEERWLAAGRRAPRLAAAAPAPGSAGLEEDGATAEALGRGGLAGEQAGAGGD